MLSRKNAILADFILMLPAESLSRTLKILPLAPTIAILSPTIAILSPTIATRAAPVAILAVPVAILAPPIAILAARTRTRPGKS